MDPRVFKTDKTDQLSAVLTALAPFQEADAVSSEKAPVHGCYRHLTNRPGLFDYHVAIQAGIDIGMPWPREIISTVTFDYTPERLAL